MSSSAMRQLFVAPVKVRLYTNYGWDARDNMMFCRDGDAWKPRGWGRIQYHDDGTLYDAWCAEFYATVEDGMTAEEVCAALNLALEGTRESDMIDRRQGGGNARDRRRRRRAEQRR